MKEPMNRRNALALGGSVAGSLLAGGTLGMRAAPAIAQTNASMGASPLWQDTTRRIEQIIGAQGSFQNGLFHIGIDRNDITNVTLRGVPISPSFEINGDLYFQELGGGRVTMNSDLCVKRDEIDRFIDQFLQHGIIVQAEHQHFYDFVPIVFFIHFRATGDPIAIAQGVKAALNVTSTPFPQTLPNNPTTPLPAKELGEIIGAMPNIGSDGVVTFYVPRAEAITLGGVRISGYLNEATSISFEPLGRGHQAAAVPDFAMTASEIQDVFYVMRSQGWDVGCLYNQETDEYPQLFFSHQFRVGDALDLARQIRNGLNRTNSKFI